MMDAIILAGGFGTRLQSVVSDVPKPMAPINGRPFLEILLKSLEKKGIKRVVLSVGYKAEIIMNYFGNSYGDIELVYEVEDCPLGTGGAIYASLEKCVSHHILVMNGDTFIDINLNDLISNFKLNNDLIVVGANVRNCSRYGGLEVEENRVIKFSEKKSSGPGVINAGSYLIPKTLFDGIEVVAPFSFELFLASNINKIRPRFVLSSGYFIDIGVPEDYSKAQNLFFLSN